MEGSIQHAGLTELRRRYPWPDKRPDVVEVLHHAGGPAGWCDADSIKMFCARVNAQTRLIVELGSWLGRSATELLKAAPHAMLICIDHWEGSKEHRQNPKWAHMLPILYPTFLRNMWAYQDRVVPMQCTTLRAMQEVADLGLVPELLYHDASHEKLDVAADIAKGYELFPHAFTCGHDFNRESVREAVEQVFGHTGRLNHARFIWWLD